MELLAAVDLRDAGRVLRAAGGLARRLGARVDLLHVPHPQADPARVRARLAALLTQLPAGHRGDALRGIGDPAETILERAPAWDLLIMGTRSQPGPVGALGSVARRVSARAPGPVVVVPRAAEEREGLLRVLLPLALPPPDDVLRVVVATLRPEQLDVAHVVRPAPAGLRQVADLSPGTDPSVEAVVQALQELRHSLRRCGLRDAGVYVEAASERDLGQALVDVARRLDVDLIALSPRRAPNLRELLFGSTTRHVLLHARRPVLVLPAQGVPDR